MGKVTIKDIAKRSGYSKTSVSFAFNNPGRVAKETYEHIMAVAQEMGYSPDPAARILATRKTKTVGFLLPQPIEEIFDNQYLSELMRGIGSVCHREGFMLSVLSPLKGIISQTIQQACVDGIIILGVSNSSSVHAQFRQRKLPYVTMDADNSADYLNVGIDDEKAAEEMLDLLLDYGHRRICFCTLQPISTDIVDTEFSLTSDNRGNGILKSIKKHNLEETAKNSFIFYEASHKQEEAVKKAREILTMPNRPTAIYCMGDHQAIPFYFVAAQLGLKIPQDLSITGFDDLPSSSMLFPPLTVVHQPGYEKGRLAAELLVASLNGQECKSVLMESPVIERGSTAKVPENTK
ncbi:MAG: LacI family transcriptional regulator [Treponemataceae bacterium]|nr:LacI family transcriptional regulator [Treponemataceae bacterium]